MKEMADGDIDLYADVESDFQAEDFSKDESDLFDDAITKDDKKIKSTSNDTVTSKSANTTLSSSTQQFTKQYRVYIGNLTWWTTDAEIQQAILDCGVTDIQEVKFQENKINGQSKGFCLVIFGSDSSVKTVMAKIPKIELHGQVPVVTYATRQALAQFEAQSSTRAVPQQHHNQRQQPTANPSGPSMQVPPPRGPPLSVPPPSVARPPPPTHAIMSAPPPSIVSHPPPMTSLPPPHMLPPVMAATHPPRIPPPVVMGGPPPSVPAPHVNPAFFGGSVIPQAGVSHLGLSEVEFEEIMNRNRTVSSSAIARAVQDAANSEFSSAIETLATAISLIKQSKVSADERCRVLIASLQDTLRGIEKQSYDLRRERSRSRDRTHRSSRRRSYSRERDYRDYYEDRSRERDHYRRPPEDKYYDDRARYKEDRVRMAEHEMRDRGREREREYRERSGERERRH